MLSCKATYERNDLWKIYFSVNNKQVLTLYVLNVKGQLKGVWKRLIYLVFQDSPKGPDQRQFLIQQEWDCIENAHFYLVWMSIDILYIMTVLGILMNASLKNNDTPFTTETKKLYVKSSGKKKMFFFFNFISETMDCLNCSTFTQDNKWIQGFVCTFYIKCTP